MSDARHPFLSVIIPVYNAEKSLKKCINSIVNQKFKDIELILVNDGSKDGSETICLEFANRDQRIKYYKKENGGAYQTRLYGVEKATGKYITFCDSDDYHINNAIERINNYISIYNCDVLQFTYEKKIGVYKKKLVLVDKPTLVCDEKVYTEEFPRLLSNSWDKGFLNTNTWNKVYSSDLLKYIPSSENAPRVFWGEDLILNSYILKDCKKMLFVPDVLYAYTSSGGTKSFSENTMYDLDVIYKRKKELFPIYSGELLQKIKKGIYAEIAAWFYIWIIDALSHIDEEKLEKKIEDILELEGFVDAKTYYDECPEDWEAVNLLRKSDSKEYIKCAKLKKNEKVKLSKRIKSFIKRIVAV